MRQILVLTLVALVPGCGSSDMASPAMDMKVGATPDGSQDAGYFRGLLLSGTVPQDADITLEGFISEHDIPSPPGQTCDQVLCLSALLGHDQAVAEGSTATFLQLGMASNVDLSTRARMPVNLAVVVDVSGSMSSSSKLEYVKQGLLLMLDELSAEDRLALVTYSSSAQVIVASQLVTSPAIFREAIEALYPAGSTNLYDGMVLGYDEVQANLSAESMPRVMLLSDGLVNTGISDSEQILAKSAEYNAEGIGVTTIGVGLDFNHDLMRELSEQGGGNFYFIEDPSKITTVFKDELDFLITPLANNLNITISFSEGFSMADVYGLAYDWDTDGNMVVTVPTVFASKRGGAILIRIDNTDAIEGEVVTQIAYSYEPLDDTGTVLAEVSEIVDGRFPTLDNLGYGFDSAGVHKAIVLWNMIESFHAASNAYHVDYDTSKALELIESLAVYVDQANAILEDEEIARDRAELINQFAINLGGYLGEPYYEDGMPYGYPEDYVDDHHGSMFPFGCASTPGATLPAIFAAALLVLVMRRRRRS